MIIDSGGDVTKVGDAFRIIEESKKTINLKGCSAGMEKNSMKVAQKAMTTCIVQGERCLIEVNEALIDKGERSQGAED